MRISEMPPDFAIPTTPLRLWIAPNAQNLTEAIVPNLAHLNPEVTFLSSDRKPPGPAIALLDAADLSAPDSDDLYRIVQRGLPGRPIVIGGTRERATLLNAINRWHAFRVVPSRTPLEVVAVAISQAFESLRVEDAIRSGVTLLESECDVLQNALQELRTAQEKLLHAERLTTVGRFAGSLKTRLQSALEELQAVEQVVRRHTDDPDTVFFMESAVEGVQSFHALLQDILALASQQDRTLNLKPYELDEFFRQSLRFCAHEPLVARRHLVEELNSGATVNIDRPRLLHVLMNLLRNAAQATEPRAEIFLRTMTEESRAIIEVEDTGCGMSEEVLSKIFTPFFTTKGRDGMGLGLRLSQSTVELHGGTLTCTSEPGKGSCFRIELPQV